MEKEVHWIVYIIMLVVAVSVFFLLSSHESEISVDELIGPKTVSETAQVSLTILDRDEVQTDIGQES
jgi:hypothetical protein|tara:strand:+ start:381 stop:581 length:201 start_codon:yes stop_codon:yes gene_type:complete